MEFAGRQYIYLSEKKINKLNSYKSLDKKEEKQEKEENVVYPPHINQEEKLKENKLAKDLFPELLNNLKKKQNEKKEGEIFDKKIDLCLSINEDGLSSSYHSNDSNSCYNISNKHLNDKYSNSGSYKDNISCDFSLSGGEKLKFEIKDEKENYFQETDLNIFCVDFNRVLDKDFSLKDSPIRCKKCTAILNMYSHLNLLKNDKYKWECEFCRQINKIKIKQDSIPLNKNISYILKEPILEVKNQENKKIEEKQINLDDDTSLIFCFDISGSMDEKYDVEKDIYDKIKEALSLIDSKKEIDDNLSSDILLKNNNKNNNKFQNKLYIDELDNLSNESSSIFEGKSLNFIPNKLLFPNDIQPETIGYKISRLEMIKYSIYSMINKLLKESPNIKVGLVTFEDYVTIYGDCLYRNKIIKEIDDENKIKSLGDKYSYLISNPISKSSNFILSKLFSIKTLRCTALGPGIISSLSLLKNAKKGSRIFLCTDGLANSGLGKINKLTIQENKLFYEKIGEEAEKKGISINLITFKDEHSDIEILMKMIEKSGGEITRVTPEKIVENFSGLVESNIIGFDTNLEIILPNNLKFRNEDNEKLENFKSKYKNFIGNIKSNMRKYFEFKFKKTRLLFDMNLNLNNVKKLPIQCIIEYRDKNNGKYIKVYTALKSISSNKEEILKQANLEIVSGNAIQKSANMAMKGNYRKAQRNTMAWKKFLSHHKNQNDKAKNIYAQFKSNMNNFNQNLIGAQINNNGISDRLAGQIYNFSKSDNQVNNKKKYKYK